MADVKISGLPASTVPLAGTEVLPIVQGGATKQVSIANVTAGRAIAATSITTDTYKAASSSGGALQNSGGTPQLQWGAGGGNNLSVDVAININPANAAVAISPTGTGTVAISPAGALTINPTAVSTINNASIGATTRSTGAFTTLASNGATTFTANTASTSTTTGTAVITGGLGVSGRINAANFDGIVGANTAAAGNFTTLSATSTITSGALTVNQMTFAGTAGVLSGVDDILYGAAAAGSSSQFTLGKALALTNVQMVMNGVVNKATRIRFQESGVDKWLIGNGAASEAGQFQIFDATNGTGVELAKNSNAWAALSDERLKDIIEPITNALSKVATLRTVIGKYKKDKEGTRRVFLIAQDVLAVLPEAVDIAEDKIGTLSLKSTDTIPLLIAALNELNSKFDAYVASHP